MANTTSAGVQRELGRLTEAVDNLSKQHQDFTRRFDKLEEQNDAQSHSLSGMTQALSSQSSVIQTMALEKCGERLDKLEARCVNLPDVEKDVLFYKRVIGAGYHFAWRIAAIVAGSTAVGGWLGTHIFK